MTWQIKKGGCNHLVASDYLVTWRTAFQDLAGVGSMALKGMEAGCTPSLVVSGGVLNSPNYGTRLKRPRMTALAMTHQPENEAWFRCEPDVSSVGEPFRTIVKELRFRCRNSAADKSPVLDLTFTPKVGEPLICGVELIQADK